MSQFHNIRTPLGYRADRRARAFSLTWLLAGVMAGAVALVGWGAAKATVPGAALDRPSCDEGVPVVETQEGPICGVAQQNADARARAYLGIPFAAAPVDELRWRNPQPAPRRGELFRATEVGPVCAQTEATKGRHLGEEDCLFVNVFTPRTPSSQPWPVLVYLPGGGFILGGSSNTFDGTYLAGRGEVVVVTMNYRLGTLGFLRYMADRGTIPGNFGIKDQISAMTWVRDNIAAFGGDPEKVTLFGESAGAMSTGLHLFSIPESTELFRAAIMQSNVMSVPYAEPAKATVRGLDLIEKICNATGEEGDCPRTDAWLREVPLNALMAAQFEALPFGGMPGLLATGMAQGMLWAQTVGVSPIVGQAYEGYHPGSSPKPYVFGMNRNEGFFFLPNPADFSRERYESARECNFRGPTKERILSYEFDGEQPYNPDSYKASAIAGMSGPAQAMARVITDYGFAAGNLNSANRAWEQMLEAGLSVHGYYFTEVSNFTYTGLQWCSPETRRVCHTTELPYVFHNLLSKEETGDFVPAENVTAAETRLAEEMNLAWTRFSKHPFATEPHRGWVALEAVSDGPYLQWETPVSRVDDLGAIVHYELWSTIQPTDRANEAACLAATSANDGP